VAGQYAGLSRALDNTSQRLLVVFITRALEPLVSVAQVWHQCLVRVPSECLTASKTTSPFGPLPLEKPTSPLCANRSPFPRVRSVACAQ
jgi:hypothetical protein